MSRLFDEAGRVLISPSRLKMWTECPMKWKAAYVDEIRTPPSPSMVFGTAIHKALEAFHRSRWLGNPVTAEELEVVFATTLQVESNPADAAPVEVVPEMLPQARKMIELYTSEFREEKVAAAELSLSAPLVDTETGEDLGAQLVGVVDMVTEDRRIVDIKSSARTTNLFDLAIAHSVQTDSYRYLLENAGQKPTGVEIRLLVRKKAPELQTFRLPMRSNFAAFLDLSRRYVAFVRAREAVGPRPNLYCGATCPAYVPCRQFHGLPEVA